MPENKPLQNFAASLFTPEVLDTGIDFCEISLDELTKQIFRNVPDILTDIPIIKSFISLGHLGINVQHIFRLKKQLVFIQSLQKQNPSSKAIKKRLDAAKSNEKWFYEEIETVLVYLERSESIQKSRIYSLIYIDLIEGKIDFNRFIEYSTILDRLFTSDISQLIELYEEHIFSNDIKEHPEKYHLAVFSSMIDPIESRRLESIGLLISKISMYPGESVTDKFTLTIQGIYLGEKIYKLGYKGKTIK